MIMNSLDGFELLRLISADNAKMPPSPSLSARNKITKYLMEMTKINDQNIKDSTPKILSESIATPLSDSRNAYKGLVPISPYTTPKAAKDKDGKLVVKLR
jgi:hypothetical protein